MEELNVNSGANAVTETPNYGLYLEGYGSTTFKEWREKINGPGDSNMMRLDAAVAAKQDKLTGTPGQVVGFDEDGNPVPQEAPEGGKAAGWKPYHIGDEPPEDTTQLWINTAAGVTQYHNGTAWVDLPVAWG